VSIEPSNHREQRTKRQSSAPILACQLGGGISVSKSSTSREQAVNDDNKQRAFKNEVRHSKRLQFWPTGGTIAVGTATHTLQDRTPPRHVMSTIILRPAMDPFLCIMFIRSSDSPTTTTPYRSPRDRYDSVIRSAHSTTQLSSFRKMPLPLNQSTNSLAHQTIKAAATTTTSTTIGSSPRPDRDVAAATNSRARAGAGTFRREEVPALPGARRRNAAVEVEAAASATSEVEAEAASATAPTTAEPASAEASATTRSTETGAIDRSAPSS